MGSLHPAVGSLEPAVGSLDPAVGSLDLAVGSLDLAVGSLDPVVGTFLFLLVKNKGTREVIGGPFPCITQSLQQQKREGALQVL